MIPTAAHSEAYDVAEALAIEDHAWWILKKLGLDPTSQHFIRTPERWTKFLQSYVNPTTNLEEVLSDGFDEDEPPEQVSKELVVQTAIPFMGVCAHHLLPFFGTAAVGYLPSRRVVGLSKLTRLIYAAGHIAPTTQEIITNSAADALYGSKAIAPNGVAILTSALHGCMAARGTETPGTRTVVSVVRGAAFTETPALEAKFMQLALEGLK